MQNGCRPPGRNVRNNLHPTTPHQDGRIENRRTAMDNGVRKSVEISIVGNLHYRQIIVVGGGDWMFDNELKHGRRWNAENKQMVF